MKDNELVTWTQRYELGIPLIDQQHKQLVQLTNNLFLACLNGETTESFAQAVAEAVDYTKYHFNAEEKLLEQVRYPNIEAHKKEHRDFVNELAQAVQAFKDGKKFVPNNFARYLRDWILTHIAISDKIYADYIFNLKRQNLLQKAKRTAVATAGAFFARIHSYRHI